MHGVHEVLGSRRYHGQSALVVSHDVWGECGGGDACTLGVPVPGLREEVVEQVCVACGGFEKVLVPARGKGGVLNDFASAFPEGRTRAMFGCHVPEQRRFGTRVSVWRLGFVNPRVDVRMGAEEHCGGVYQACGSSRLWLGRRHSLGCLSTLILP